VTPRTLSFLLIAAGAAGGCFGHSYGSAPRIAVVSGDPIVQMKEPGEFPVVMKPALVTSGLHTDPPDADSNVLGILVGAVPRAYPIGLLDRFEVVNDSVPDLPFVVTRCALTGITVAYDRRVAGRVLEFQNSGALWRDTLVLRDRETGTYWTSATGRALYGPLAGEALTPVPAHVVRTADWARAFPESLYMDLDKDTSEPLFLRLYGISQWQGLSGGKTTDTRRKPKEEVLTVGAGDEVVAFTATEIEAAGHVDTALAGKNVSIWWDAVFREPRAYGPDEKEMTIVPMFWFAAARHYASVRTLSDRAENGRAAGNR
jgi:hypothetical protein